MRTAFCTIWALWCLRFQPLPNHSRPPCRRAGMAKLSMILSSEFEWLSFILSIQRNPVFELVEPASEDVAGQQFPQEAGWIASRLLRSRRFGGGVGGSAACRLGDRGCSRAGRGFERPQDSLGFFQNAPVDGIARTAVRNSSFLYQWISRLSSSAGMPSIIWNCA